MISGPKNAGKSILAKMIANRLKKKFAFLDCSKSIDRQKLENAGLFFSSRRGLLIILDEVQFMPQIFPAIKNELDMLNKPGRFLLISSFEPHFAFNISTGNLQQFILRELDGISLKETRSAKIPRQKHWFRGGLPVALKAKSDKAFVTWTDNFIHEFIRQYSNTLPKQSFSPEKLLQCLKMMASANGNILNLESLARSLGVSGPTAKKYLRWLENAYLVRPIPAWLPDNKKRLIKSPKFYLRNTGLLHSLPGIVSYADLCTHFSVGASWETYVINEICKVLPAKFSVWYYRTQHGAETDLVLVKNNRPVACIDISFSEAPAPSAGFMNCIEDLKCKKNFLVYPGKNNFNGHENIRTTSLEALLEKFLPALLK